MVFTAPVAGGAAEQHAVGSCGLLEEGSAGSTSCLSGLSSCSHSASSQSLVCTLSHEHVCPGRPCRAARTAPILEARVEGNKARTKWASGRRKANPKPLRLKSDLARLGGLTHHDDGSVDSPPSLCCPSSAASIPASPSSTSLEWAPTRKRRRKFLHDCGRSLLIVAGFHLKDKGRIKWVKPCECRVTYVTKNGRSQSRCTGSQQRLLTPREHTSARRRVLIAARKLWNLLDKTARPRYKGRELA